MYGYLDHKPYQNSYHEMTVQYSYIIAVCEQNSVC